ncbi:MAG: serine/threonine-protein phosphatase [Phycisphaerales bacterium]|nr:serine/threonine-protein phosphatase [Phycisphaerales bacterium]
MPAQAPQEVGTIRFRIVLFGGIFLIFAPIGVLIALVQSEPPGWLYGLTMWTLSGAIALGWASMFNRRGKWFWLLPVLVLVPIFGFPWFFTWAFRFDWFAAGYAWPQAARRVFMLVLGILSWATGFPLIALYINRAERIATAARTELRLAARMHDTLVPSIDLSTGNLLVIASSTPSSDMGGDLVDAVVQGDRADLLLADVSGHGVSAGIVMAMLKGAFRTRLLQSSQPEEALCDLNAVLHDLTTAEVFVTLAWIRVERGVDCTVALAGHLPVLRYNAQTKAVDRINNESLPLGVDPSQSFVVQSFKLAPGDTLFVCTDGLMEVLDGKRRQLGFDALEQCFAHHAGEHLREIESAIRALAAAHGTSHDDQSVLLARVR